MSAKVRLIARLDLKGPNVIKGIQFDGYRVVGTPELLAERYYQEGIDELVCQDTVASLYQRNNSLEIIRKIAKKIFVPLTLVGGMRTVEDIRDALRAGADKVGINTGAVENPKLLSDGIRLFGSQCIVASLEVHRQASGLYEIWTHYGRQVTGLDAFEWAVRVAELGVGEILLTCVDRDGMGTGFDEEFSKKLISLLPIPVVISAGAGCKEHVVKAFKELGADAVACASIFHYYYREFVKLPIGNSDFIQSGYGGTKTVPVHAVSISEVKAFMLEHGVLTRASS